MNITLGQKFTHPDYKHGKRPITLIVHKVYPDGQIIAHRENEKADKNGFYDSVYCFPKGLAEAKFL